MIDGDSFEKYMLLTPSKQGAIHGCNYIVVVSNGCHATSPAVFSLAFTPKTPKRLLIQNQHNVGPDTLPLLVTITVKQFARSNDLCLIVARPALPPRFIPSDDFR